jgi:pimeloyl-ACP methyl ester carboxylesterase
MPKLRANGIEIEAELSGPEDGRPLLLVMGLGSQLIHWHEGFCRGLEARGFRLVRFDNRDVGLSTWLDDRPAPEVQELIARVRAGDAPAVPYLLSDMAADTAGLLDALELERAHVLGVSMGGMIAQTLALEHPERVASLISVMSTTGDPGLPPATPEAMEALLRPAPEQREAYVEHIVANWRLFGSPGFPFDEAFVRDRAARAFDRAFHPQGAQRQLAAILASGSRREALRGLDVPALVIHGDSDPLVPVEGGRDTAEAIPGAVLEIVEGMGHDLPRGAWPRIHDAVEALARRAG